MAPKSATTPQHLRGDLESRPYPDGPHTLTAVARDDAGNTTTSPSVTVNVLNTTAPPAATATRFESSDAAIVYTDGVPADWTAPSVVAWQQKPSWSGRHLVIQPLGRRKGRVPFQRHVGALDWLPLLLGRHRPRLDRWRAVHGNRSLHPAVHVSSSAFRAAAMRSRRPSCSRRRDSLRASSTPCSSNLPARSRRRIVRALD